jgi:hypothetical protein
MHLRMNNLAAILLLLCASCQLPKSTNRAPEKSAQTTPKPALADPYLDLIVTYTIYAKTLWHEADAGGYWGPGIADRESNGGVRGMSNTALGYALVIHAMDENWLPGQLLARLDAAELDRAALLDCVKKNLIHLAAHHVSAQPPLEPKWGLSWQSSLWTGAWGPAALLVWNDLPKELQQDLIRVAAAEADRVASKPPKDAKPGDTGAEENAWDTHAPAIALALSPDHPHAPRWLRAAQIYAANTYSTKADHISTAALGPDRVRDIVKTANLFDDFTLENHGFFHPAYLQVSGELLGEAWLYLQMGDRLHGTHLAPKLKPYALHHAKDVWENVEKLLLLPSGELTYPCGNDWTFNSSITPSYLAYIATALNDPAAYRAAAALPQQAIHHREHSPPDRILGDTNLEWWWEPILIQRCSTALLQFAMRPNPIESPTTAAIPIASATKLFPDSKVWIDRNATYFTSLAWGKRKMATFTPMDGNYLTLPIDPGILPNDVDRLIEQFETSDAHGIVLESPDRRRSVAVCFPHSVLWLSAGALQPLGLENDPLSGPRTLYFNDTHRLLPTLEPVPPFQIAASSVNIDNKLALVTTSDGFKYTHAGEFNRKSAAIDRIIPLSTWGAWQMTPNVKSDQTWRLDHAFNAKFDGRTATVTVQDGPAGRRYRVRALLAPTSPATTPATSQTAGSSVSVDRVD